MKTSTMEVFLYMKVFFVTELLLKSGMGHFTRCHSIADAFWKRKIKCEFIVATDLPELKKNENYTYKEIDWIKNSGQLLPALKCASIVFVDSYHISQNIFTLLNETFRHLAFLDDENKTTYPRGFVINGNLIADSLKYEPKENIKYLLGQNFQPLRKEFWEHEKRGTKAELKDILITLGGTDSSSFINALAKEINSMFPGINLHILSNRTIPSIIENCTWYSNLTSLEMLRLIKNCDLAISAAGQTTYELAATQTPGILVKLAENQSLNIESWCRNGYFEFAGSVNEEETIPNILMFIESHSDPGKRTESSVRLQKQFTTTGSRNIVTEILKSIADKELTLRKVSSDDLLKVFELSNEDEVRRLSFTSGKIDLEAHITWFNSKLTSGSTFYLMAEFAGEFAGQVRYEIKNNESMVGISICKEYRGLGLSDKILINSAKLLSETFKEVRKIIAYIKEENITSQKTFEKAGYVLVEKEDKEYNAMRYEFQYKL
jgi:spore coat polysaccharide biosynthesis predicted glycosyltransferase SpsG/RimJ/RimL family protein N-acetyltransferase